MSNVWQKHVRAPNTPEGFTVRTTLYHSPSEPGGLAQNPDGVEVMLEQWKAGTEEPPHAHPGDDMTVVVEGKMVVQFFKSGPAGLEKDGEPLVLSKGDAGYVAANRIHDAKYVEDCKLVYVHDGAFGFHAH